MKRRSFFLRLFISNLLLVLVILLLGAAWTYPPLNLFYDQENQARQEELTDLAATLLGDSWSKAENPAALKQLCSTLLKDSPLRLTVVAADGQVLGDNRFDPQQMDNHATSDRPEIVEALGGRPHADTRRSKTADEEFRYVARPIRSQGRVVAAVRLAMPVKAIRSNTEVIRHVLIAGGTISIISAALLGLVVGFYWYQPLRDITQAARQIASGSLNTKARVSGSRELAQLALALNDMRDSLASQIQTIAAQREDLQTVVANLGEGIVALDGGGNIVLMNATCGLMLGADAAQAAGKPLATVVRLADVVDLSNQAIAQRSAQERQVEVDIHGARRILDVHAAPLHSPTGIAQLLVLRDVTDLVATSTMKAEFVANASHELRTPLATLRAAVDNMQDIGPMDEATLRQFHEILSRHVARLENMTKDLLDLHLAESGKVKLRAEDVDTQQLRDWALGMFSPRAAEKGVALTVQTPAAASLRSDRKLLELILQNLLDNAIKFTPSGGSVTANVECREERLILRVSDTGCGIRKEDQSRVFERFFQIDAARSGDTKARGTGLGLAIVKHAAERLDATIQLQSELGKGTTVTVSVPGM